MFCRRAAGTPELNGVNVNKSVYKDFLLEKVIPAIMAKWPRRIQLSVWVQKDNAPVYVALNEPDVLAARDKGRTWIRLVAHHQIRPTVTFATSDFRGETITPVRRST